MGPEPRKGDRNLAKVFLSPFQGSIFFCCPNQGLRSRCSLHPWLPSAAPSGATKTTPASRTRQQPAVSNPGFGITAGRAWLAEEFAPAKLPARRKQLLPGPLLLQLRGRCLVSIVRVLKTFQFVDRFPRNGRHSPESSSCRSSVQWSDLPECAQTDAEPSGTYPSGSRGWNHPRRHGIAPMPVSPTTAPTDRTTFLEAVRATDLLTAAQFTRAKTPRRPVRPPTRPRKRCRGRVAHAVPGRAACSPGASMASSSTST